MLVLKRPFSPALHITLQIVGLPYVAFFELVTSVIVFVDLILTLYPNIRKKTEVMFTRVNAEDSRVKNEDVSWWVSQ